MYSDYGQSFAVSWTFMEGFTKYCAEPGNTTMRAMPYAETTLETDRKQITQFHSNQQVSATILMLMNKDSAFSPLFTIQFAAFLMTMVRKNIIRPNTWHLLYSWALMSNIFVCITMPLHQCISTFIGTNGFCILRMKLRMNKYIAWTIMFSIITLLDFDWIETYTYANTIIYIFCCIYILKNVYATRALYNTIKFTAS